MSSALEQRPFGTTDTTTTALGLGCGHIAKHSFATGVDTIHRALELGVRYFDTAPFYGRGASQAVIGEALQNRTEDYLLATKVGRLRTPSHFRSVDAIRAQLDENLRLLRRTEVDVLQIHEADWHAWWSDTPREDEGSNVDHAIDYEFDEAPVMRVLREAREQGVCKAIGVTGNSAADTAFVLRHVDVDTYLLAFNYNPVEREARTESFPLAREKGVAMILGGVLNRGQLTTKSEELFESQPKWTTPQISERLRGLYQISDDTGISLPSLALRFVLANPSVTVALIGAATPAEIEENVEAASAGPLPPDIHQAVEDLVKEPG